MNKYCFLFFLAISINLLHGCGYLQEKKFSNYMKSPILSNNGDSLEVKNKLYDQYNKWRGVRYKNGGLNQRGIDCSGFVHVTFKTKLDIHLPRTTQLQATLGVEVKKAELRVGDLVFFKTGLFSRHVGIYLEKNNFLHASQSQGVIISRLNDAYWTSNYWKSIRL